MALDAEALFLQFRFQLQAVKPGEINVQQELVGQLPGNPYAFKIAEQAFRQGAEQLFGRKPGLAHGGGEVPSFLPRIIQPDPFGLKIRMESQTVEAYQAGAVQFHGLRGDVQTEVQLSVVEIDGGRGQPLVMYLQPGYFRLSGEAVRFSACLLLEQTEFKAVELYFGTEAALDVRYCQAGGVYVDAEPSVRRVDFSFCVPLLCQRIFRDGYCGMEMVLVNAELRYAEGDEVAVFALVDAKMGHVSVTGQQAEQQVEYCMGVPGIVRWHVFLA